MALQQRVRVQPQRAQAPGLDLPPQRPQVQVQVHVQVQDLLPQRGQVQGPDLPPQPQRVQLRVLEQPVRRLGLAQAHVRQRFQRPMQPTQGLPLRG